MILRDVSLELMGHTYAVFMMQLGEGVAFIRSDANPKLFPDPQDTSLAEDSTSGPECPDIELLAVPMGYSPPGEDTTEPAFGLHVAALRPTSLGTVRLRSNDPFDSPVIDPRFATVSYFPFGGTDFCLAQVPGHAT